MTTWMPIEVRRCADHIEHGTGQPPQVEKIGDRRFRLTAENERVRMTLDLKMTSPGKWVWAHSRLWVDGVERARVESAEAFYRLFADPDSGGRIKVDYADEEPFEPYPLEDPPPPAVQQLVARVAGMLARRTSDATVTCGRTVDGTPLVEITTSRGYVRFKMGTELKMRAVVDGYDATGDAHGTIEDVLASFMDAHDPARPAPAAPGRARRASDTQRNTGVEVRRTTVIRV